MLGCDGKSETRDNEDFWAHARKAQYDELVDSGHRCHPTFDRNRQKTTYQRFLDSVEETVTTGERKHGKVYRSLQPSNIPALKPRALSPERLAEAGLEPPYPVRSLAMLLPRNTGPVSEPAAATADLPPKAGISRCEVDGDGLLVVSGFVLSTTPVTRVDVKIDGKVIGEAVGGGYHAGAAREHAAHGDGWCGYEFAATVGRTYLRGVMVRFEAFGADGPLVSTQRAIKYP